MSDCWLSVEEIAEYLGVSKDTVYAWRSSKLAKLMNGCALAVQHRMKLEVRYE